MLKQFFYSNTDLDDSIYTDNDGDDDEECEKYIPENGREWDQINEIINNDELLDKRLLIDFKNYHESRIDEKGHKIRMETFFSHESELYHKKQAPNQGDEIYKGIMTTLTHLKKISLYGYQLDFCKLCMPPLFKYIYKNEWQHNRENILKRHGMTDVYDEVLFTSPRRMGKTITLAFYCLAVAVNVKKDPYRPFVIAVFATTKDASKRFVDECEIGWGQIDKNDDFYMYKKASQIILVNKKDFSDIRHIIAYCGSGTVSFTFFFLHHHFGKFRHQKILGVRMQCNQ